MAHGEGFAAVEGAGRSLAAPGQFASDDGAADLGIRNAEDSVTLLEALRTGRVIVAVVAVAIEVEEVGGVQADKSSEMAVVSMVAKDGRRGLLVFTGLDTLRAWDPTARPVPVSGLDAARAALEDDCEAIIIDVAGPRTQVVSESEVITLTGRSPLDHARQLAQRHLDGLFGEQQVLVTVVDDRLRIESTNGVLDAQALAGGLSPRIVALVPAGIEVVDA